MAAPTLVARYDSGDGWGSNVNPRVTPVTSQAGDIIVVYAAGEDFGFNDLATPTGNGLGYTLNQTYNSSGYSPVYIWSATDNAGGTNWNLSVTDNASNGNLFGVAVFVFRNSGGVGAGNSNNGTSGAPSVTFSTTQANSGILVLSADWNGGDGSSRTWLTINSVTPTIGNGYEKDYTRTVGNYTVYGAYYPDTGSAGSVTAGLSAPTGQKFSIAALEVLGTAGPTATTAWLGV